METYTSNEIQELQKIELKMLEEFNDICIKNNIPYFILFGTGIGAVRHKGFIPWDDDIDVGMMRSDFDRFKNAFSKIQHDDLFLITPSDSYEWHDKIFPRLYKKNTEFETYSWLEQFEKSGEESARPIWIDIFLFDYASNNYKTIIKKTKLYKWLYLYSKFKARLITDKGIKKIIDTAAKRTIYDVLHRIPNISSHIYDIYERTVFHEKSDYIVSYDSWEDKDVIASFSKYEQVFPTISIEFNGLMVSIQNDYDTILSKIYGDYMKLPDEENRIAHKPIRLKLNSMKKEK